MRGLSTVCSGIILVLWCTGLSVSQSYEKECTVKEAHQRNCLNGGECFVLQLEAREPSCRCPRRFTGRRCQDLNMIALYDESTLPVNRTAMYLITIGSVLGGFVGGILLTVCISSWYRRRLQRNTHNDSQNGHIAMYTDVPAGKEELLVDHV